MTNPVRPLTVRKKQIIYSKAWYKNQIENYVDFCNELNTSEFRFRDSLSKDLQYAVVNIADGGVSPYVAPHYMTVREYIGWEKVSKENLVDLYRQLKPLMTKIYMSWNKRRK